jgi:hypothetical protein
LMKQTMRMALLTEMREEENTGPCRCLSTASLSISALAIYHPPRAGLLDGGPLPEQITR